LEQSTKNAYRDLLQQLVSIGASCASKLHTLDDSVSLDGSVAKSTAPSIAQVASSGRREASPDDCWKSLVKKIDQTMERSASILLTHSTPRRPLPDQKPATKGIVQCSLEHFAPNQQHKNFGSDISPATADSPNQGPTSKFSSLVDSKSALSSAGATRTSQPDGKQAASIPIVTASLCTAAGRSLEFSSNDAQLPSGVATAEPGARSAYTIDVLAAARTRSALHDATAQVAPQAAVGSGALGRHAEGQDLLRGTDARQLWAPARQPHAPGGQGGAGGGMNSQDIYRWGGAWEDGSVGTPGASCPYPSISTAADRRSQQDAGAGKRMAVSVPLKVVAPSGERSGAVDSGARMSVHARACRSYGSNAQRQQYPYVMQLVSIQGRGGKAAADMEKENTVNWHSTASNVIESESEPAWGKMQQQSNNSIQPLMQKRQENMKPQGGIAGRFFGRSMFL
jgi:hypothetical protein